MQSEQYRNEQHRKTIRHFHQVGDCHELTFSCHDRLPLLEECNAYSLLAESVNLGLEKHGLNLSAYVFMPEHVHLLVWPQDPRNFVISAFLKSVKLSLSTKVKHQLIRQSSLWLRRLTVQERPGKRCFRFWLEGPGYDRNLQSLDAVASSLEYIHMNPVKRGMCSKAVDWPWSSARHYIADVGPREAPTSKLNWTPLPAEFLA